MTTTCVFKQGVHSRTAHDSSGLYAMSNIAEKIYREVRQLPEHLAREVYDFLRFVEARHGIAIRADEAAPSTARDWKEFFERHGRTVDDAQPVTRDEVYAGRLCCGGNRHGPSTERS